MSVTTSHHISRYYDYYRDKEIVFTKANLKSLRIDPRQIYLKSNGGQWPCIINSSSLQQAKVIVGTSSGIYGTIQKNRTAPISIRYCFFDQNNEPIQFSVNCNVIDYKYTRNKRMYGKTKYSIIKLVSTALSGLKYTISIKKKVK